MAGFEKVGDLTRFPIPVCDNEEIRVGVLVGVRNGFWCEVVHFLLWTPIMDHLSGFESVF